MFEGAISKTAGEITAKLLEVSVLASVLFFICCVMAVGMFLLIRANRKDQHAALAAAKQDRDNAVKESNAEKNRCYEMHRQLNDSFRMLSDHVKEGNNVNRELRDAIRLRSLAGGV